MINDDQFTTNIPKVVPYDTGKIKIGCRYEPPRIALSDEETVIQGALLPGDRKTPENWWVPIFEWTVIIGALTATLYMYLGSA